MLRCRVFTLAVLCVPMTVWAQTRFEHFSYYNNLPAEVVKEVRTPVAAMQAMHFREWYRRENTDSIVRSYYPNGRLKMEAALHNKEGYPVWNKEYADDPANYLMKEYRWLGPALKEKEWHYAYDATGLSSISWEEYGIAHQRTYTREQDAKGYITREQRFLDNVQEYDQRFQYDAKGRKTVTEHFDAQNNLQITYRFRYSGNGKLLEENQQVPGSQPNSQVYAYDEKGLLLTISLYKDSTLQGLQSFAYDASGRKREMVQQHANGYPYARYQYAHDENGSLREEAWGYAPYYYRRTYDPRGIRIDHWSNYADTITTKRLPSHRTDSIRVHNGGAYIIHYLFDANGRIVENSGSDYKTNYTYGDCPTPVSVITKGTHSQRTVAITMDSLCRMVSSTENMATFDRHGGEKSEVRRRYYYDVAGRMIKEEARWGNDSLFYRIDWQYNDDTLEKVSLQQSDQFLVYTFRQDGLLESYARKGWETIHYSYVFDAHGNWIERMEKKVPHNAIVPGRTFRSFTYL